MVFEVRFSVLIKWGACLVRAFERNSLVWDPCCRVWPANLVFIIISAYSHCFYILCLAKRTCCLCGFASDFCYVLSPCHSCCLHIMHACRATYVATSAGPSLQGWDLRSMEYVSCCCNHSSILFWLGCIWCRQGLLSCWWGNVMSLVIWVTDFAISVHSTMSNTVSMCTYSNVSHPSFVIIRCSSMVISSYNLALYAAV